MSRPPPPFEQAIRVLREHAPGGVDLAIVLGSGLSGAATVLSEERQIPVSEIPGYPQSSVAGHRGLIALGTLAGVRYIVFKGRLHYYERGSVEEVLAPVRVASGIGARIMVLTNAAGGIRWNLAPGDLMLVEDHLNLTFLAPPSADLPGSARKGRIYDAKLLATARRVARELGMNVPQGVYAGVLGPSYETAAEIAMLSRVGADVVGMSTVLEAEEAARNGMRVLGLTLVTNRATGTSDIRPSHDEVTLMGSQAAKQIGRLLEGIVRAVSEGDERLLR